MSNIFSISSTKDFAPERAMKGVNIFEKVKEFAVNKRLEKKKLIIACYSEGSRDRLQNMLSDHNMHSVYVNHWNNRSNVSGKSVGLAVVPLEKGFETDKFVLLSEQDIFGDRIIRTKKKKKSSSAFLAESANILAGEIIVHKEHGIAKFEGLTALEVNNSKHDCFLLIYDGGDKLFVPVENSDIITRYGSEDSEIRLDKLGGVSWQKRKAKLKNRIKVAAEELLKIAAERELNKSHVLTKQEGIYEEFRARFPFTETEDQENAINETLEDIAKGKPMDRLICGDTGFGKTEVALRAAFVAAINGVQVSIVTPTTLLCRQHYKLFMERFDGLPINIRQLSRLVTAKEAKQTRELMEQGKIDIVIGTHSLLSKSIKFKNLGLLIVDEEQHFGVGQKEQLKQLKSDVHVLTLSATPIPRTLQLAMSGIRELSLISTPPVDRLAVRTFVMPFDPVVVREALMREHLRGGQSFYIVPRIKDIAGIKSILSELTPELKVQSAHGQMSANDLDEIMNNFYEGKFDVLLATTIVESGLDIPNANTLILHKSDMFGLSQLYQLRGRVGRSKTRGYAYLTLPHRKTPTKLALKRLEVMERLDTLGVGFSVASSDMDIRGAGNLLGDEQSGHIKEVGVELYQQMLEEAVTNAKHAKQGEIEEINDEEFSPQINLGMSILIPDYFVENINLRMGLYRRAGQLSNVEEVESFAIELVDRFGKLPNEVGHFLEIIKIKILCKEIGIEKVDAGPKGLLFSFHTDTFNRQENLVEILSTHQNMTKIRPDGKFFISCDMNEKIKTTKKWLNKFID